MGHMVPTPSSSSYSGQSSKADPLKSLYIIRFGNGIMLALINPHLIDFIGLCRCMQDPETRHKYPPAIECGPVAFRLRAPRPMWSGGERSG